MAQIHDSFWSPIRETIRREGIPYQWEALNDRIPDAAPSHCMDNFRIAAGKQKGEHGGCVFQDSDVAKWLEGASYALADQHDPELEAVVDAAIEDVVAAQQPDGYMDTYYIINGLEKRWTNLMDNHELYCAGHMIEAAVAHYQATGKRRLLDAVLRLVDHIDGVFCPEEGKSKGYPGHPVIEMALMRLYAVTKDERHLKLAKYFVDQRGQSPLYFPMEMEKNHNRCYWDSGVLKMAYYQAHMPVRQQPDAVGHSVRALYLYSGMADVAAVTGDAELKQACERLWRSVTRRRMYLTGGVGSSEYGEAFTFDYDLPNDLIYGETCASIALVFFAWRMLQMNPKAEYADVLERALYNGVLSGMQLDGKRFFYVNPLEVLPEACEKDQRLQHVKPVRQPWFGCACCPPNLIRLVMSLQNYVASQKDGALYIHSYVGGDLSEGVGGARAALTMKTRYPWDGDVRLRLNSEGAFELALRIPGWCPSFRLTVNGEEIRAAATDGYVHLKRAWKPGDEIRLALDMPATAVQSNPRVYKNIGKVAVTRGPLVYCLEETDNGRDLHRVRLGDHPAFEAQWRPELLGGVVTLTSDALRIRDGEWDAETLYAPLREEADEPVRLTWIPYYAWSNREPGEMRVWIQR